MNKKFSNKNIDGYLRDHEKYITCCIYGKAPVTTIVKLREYINVTTWQIHNPLILSFLSSGVSKASEASSIKGVLSELGTALAVGCSFTFQKFVHLSWNDMLSFLAMDYYFPKKGFICCYYKFLSSCYFQPLSYLYDVLDTRLKALIGVKWELLLMTSVTYTNKAVSKITK